MTRWLLAMTLICGMAFAAGAAPANVDPRLEVLWAQTVRPYTQGQLWTDTECYDAGNFLMLPTRAAWDAGVPEWQADIRSLWAAWSAAGYPLPTNHLSRLQFIYAASQYLLLDPQAPSGMAVAVEQALDRLWTTEDAISYSHPTFQGARARLVYKLGLTAPAKRYHAAIIDEEFFLFAIAGDLAAYSSTVSPHPEWSTILSDIRAIGLQTFQVIQVPLPGGGLVLQPGRWSDHPDYVYAGQPEMVVGMGQVIIPDIAPDSSHYHRLPLWLRSTQSAWPTGSVNWTFYQGLIEGLRYQFLSTILVLPDGVQPWMRTTNYSDGRNGVYRWNYATVGPNNGYGPYGVSGTLTLGWWTFLGGPEVVAAHQALADQFPLSQNAIAAYIGPGTSRYQNPLVAEAGGSAYTNGFKELLCRLASGGWLDTTPPLVGGSVSGRKGPITLSAAASDNVQVSHVDFFLDNMLIGTGPGPSVSLVYDSTQLIDGAHTFVAKAFDSSGNGQVSLPVTFTVDNNVPAISAGAVGSVGTIRFSAEASDALGVSYVRWYVDGVLRGADNAAPFLISFDSNKLSDGSHTLVAKAWDAAGNVGSSAGVPFLVANHTPLISVTESGTSGTIRFGATVSDTVGVTYVRWYVDGVLRGADNTSPYLISFDSRKLANGPHTLVGRAWNASGAIGVSSTLSFTVVN